MSGPGVPANKMDKQHWENFLSYLERAQRGQLIANNVTATTAIDLDGNSSEVPSIATASNTTAADAADLINRCRLGETENVVVLSSDSENDDETIWSSYAKCKGYKRLWERARCLVFHRLIPKYQQCTSTTKEPYFIKTAQEQLFPYNKLKELAEELRKFQQDFMHNEEELKFLWKSVLLWLSAVHQSLYPMDAKYDEKFNLILIDFMVQYVNYITNISSNLAEEAKLNARVQEVVHTLTVILSANTLHALMVLLRIDLKLEYRAILDPIFRKYLTEPSLSHASADFVVYLQLIFCFKRWKMITPLKTDREYINEIAVGKPLRKLRGKSAPEVTDLTTESILPKSVPKVNENNKFFVSISDLIGFAIERKAFGTRILLVYTSLDLEDAISKYLQFYKRYVSCSPGFGMLDATTTSSIDMDILHSKTIDPALMTYHNNRDGPPRQQQQQPSQQKNKAAQVLEKPSANSKSSHDKHFDKNCDINKNRLSYSPSCSVSNLSRKHTTNTQSDTSFSSLSASLNNNTGYTQIDLTDSEGDNREYPKSKQNTTLTNTSGSNTAEVNFKNVSSPQSQPQNVQIQTSFSRRYREKKEKTNINQTTENKTNTKKTESTITLTSSSSSSDDDNSLIKYLKNSDSDTVSRHNSTVPNENAFALEQSMPRIAAIPPRCRPLVESVATKPTRKEKHCIPGEVSSTTSPDCGLQTSGTQSPQAAQARETTSCSFQYNVSNLEVHSAGTLQNAREVGIVKAVQQRVSPCPPVVVSGTCKPGSLLLGIDYSDFSSDNEDLESECGSHILAHDSWKVVEEATSSTAEIPKTLPANILFSTRSRIKSRVNSAEKNTLLKNLPINEFESHPTAPSSATEYIHESVDRPTCSRYIGKTSTTSAERQSSLSIQRISKDNKNLASICKTDSLLVPLAPALIEPNCIKKSGEELTVISKELESEGETDKLISKECEKSVVENLKSDKEKKIDSLTTAAGDDMNGAVAGIIEVNPDCQTNITDVIPVQCKEKITLFNQIDDKISRTEEENAINEASHCSITSSDPFIQDELGNSALERTHKEQNKLSEISNNEAGTKTSLFKPNIDAIALDSNLNVEEDGKIPSDETEASSEAADIESFLKEIDENLNETNVFSNNNRERCKEVLPEEIIGHDSNIDGEPRRISKKRIRKSSTDIITPISQSSTVTTEPSEIPMSVDTNLKTTENLSTKKDPFKECVSSQVDITKDSSENIEQTNDRETANSLKPDIEENEPSVNDRLTLAKNEAGVSVIPVEIEAQIDDNKMSHDNAVSINIDKESYGSEAENMDNTEKTSNIVKSKDENLDKPLPAVLETEIATVEAKMAIPTKDASALNLLNINNEVTYLGEKNAESENITETISNDEEVLRPLGDINKDSDTTYLDVTEKAKDEDHSKLPLSDNNNISDNVHQDVCERRTNTETVNIASTTSSTECRDNSDIEENKTLKEVESDSSSIAIKNVDEINEPVMNTNDKPVAEIYNIRIELSTNEIEDTNTKLDSDNKGVEIEIEAHENETCVSEGAKEQLQNLVEHTSGDDAEKSELAIKRIDQKNNKNKEICSNVVLDNLEEQDLKAVESAILTKPDISEEEAMNTNTTIENVNPIDQIAIEDSKKMCTEIHENQEKVPSCQIKLATEIKNVNEDVKSKENDTEFPTENKLSEPTKPNDDNDASENITAIELCNNAQPLPSVANKNIPADVESSSAGDTRIENSSSTKYPYSLDVEQIAKSQNDNVEETILPPIEAGEIKLTNISKNSLSSMQSFSEISPKIITEINSEGTTLSVEKVYSSNIHEQLASEDISESLNSEKPPQKIKIQQDSNKASSLERRAELKTAELDENYVEVVASEKINVEEIVECSEIPENNDVKTSTDITAESSTGTVSKSLVMGEELNKSIDSAANSSGQLNEDNLILKSEEDKTSDILNTTKDKIIHDDDVIDQVLTIIPQSGDETSINVAEAAISITEETGNAMLNSEKDVILTIESAKPSGDENENVQVLEEVTVEIKQKQVSNSEATISTNNSIDNNEISNNYIEGPSKELEDQIDKNTIKKLCEEKLRISENNEDGPTNELDNQINNAEKTIKKLCEEEQHISAKIKDEALSQDSKLEPQTYEVSHKIKDYENKSQNEQTCQESNAKQTHSNYKEGQEIDESENVQSVAFPTEPRGNISIDTSENLFETEEIEIYNVLENSQSSKGSNASGRGTPLLDEELNSLHGKENNATLKTTVSTVFKTLKKHSCISNEKTDDNISKTNENAAEIKSSKQISKLEAHSVAKTHSKLLPTMEDDLEKRTPWKMRIKRRISQCSDINKEFNLDNEEDVEEKHKEIYIHFQEPIDHEIVNFLASPAITKDADELAINISKLNIKRQQTGSESDQSQAENDGDDLQNSLLSNLGLFKRSRNNIVAETTLPSAEENKDALEGRRKKQKVLKHGFEDKPPPQPLEQRPKNYNYEEIAAITALMNMQNKCSKKNDNFPDLEKKDDKANNAITTETGKRSRLCKAKLPPRNCVSNRSKKTATITTTITTEPIKPILKSTLQGSDSSSKCRNKKKVTYDEASILRLEKNSETRKARKAYNNLKVIRSEEGALLKSGNRYIKKRLVEINARFEQDTMSSVKEFNEISRNSVTDNNNDPPSMALRNKCKISEVSEKPLPLPGRKALENTVSRLAERIKGQNIHVDQALTCNTTAPESSVNTLEHPVKITKPRRGRKKKITPESTADENNQLLMTAISENTPISKSPCPNKNITEEPSTETAYPVRITSRKLTRNSNQNNTVKFNTEASTPIPQITEQLETPLVDIKIPTCSTEPSAVPNIEDESKVVQDQTQVAGLNDLASSQSEGVGEVCDLRAPQKTKDPETKLVEHELEKDEEPMTKSKVKRLSLQSDGLGSRKNRSKFKRAFVKIKRFNVPKHSTSASEVISSNTEDTSSLLPESQIKKEPTEESIEPPSCNTLDFEIKTEEESLDAMDKFSQLQNDFSFTDPDAEINNQKSCKEIIVRPCDVILTADIINAQAIRLKEIAREKRNLKKITYFDTPARRKIALTSTQVIDAPCSKSTATTDNRNQEKISAKPKVLKKLKPLCKLKQDLEREKAKKRKNVPSQILNNCIKSDKTTLRKAAKTISTDLDVCPNKGKETFIEKKDTTTTPIVSKEVIVTEGITTTKDSKAISSRKICENKEKETLMKKENTANQILSHAKIKSDGFTSTKGLKKTSSDPLCENKEEENTQSQVLSKESMKSDDITSVNELKNITSKNVNQNKRKKTSKVKKGLNEPSHPSSQSVDITETDILKSISTEDVCENKVTDDLLQKENTLSQILSNESIKSNDMTSIKDLQTISTGEACENKIPKTLVEMENATSQELKKESIESDDITSANQISENINRNKRKKASKVNKGLKEPSHPSSQSVDIQAKNTLKSISTENYSENKESEDFLEKENTPSQILSNESIKSSGMTSTKDLQTISTGEDCENKIPNMVVQMEITTNQALRKESLESDDITSANQISENIYPNKRKKTSKARKSTSSQIVCHESIKSNDNTATIDLKMKSTKDVCENKEKKTLNEKENTPIQTMSNESIESYDMASTQDLQTISIGEACENKVPKMLVEMENAKSQDLRKESFESNDITSANQISENINLNKRKKTSKAKKSTSSQILSHESIKSNDNTATIDLKIKSTKDVCENKEKKTLNEKENTPIQTMSNESIESDDMVSTQDLQTISVGEACENKVPKMLVDMENAKSQDLRKESFESDDITSANQISENINLNKRKKTSKAKKSTSSQISNIKSISSHESIKSNVNASAIDLKTKSTKDICENKEKKSLNEKENTPNQTISNENIESDGVTSAKECISTEKVWENRETKMLVDIENSPSPKFSNDCIDLKTLSSTVVNENKEKETLNEKENTPSETVSNESIVSDGISSTKNIKTITIEEVCENKETKMVVETENVDHITSANDLKITPSEKNYQNKKKKTLMGQKSKIPSHESMKSNDSTVTTYLKSHASTEDVNETVIEKENTVNQTLKNESIDLKTIATADVCESKGKETSMDNENTPSQILSNKSIEPVDVTKPNDLENMPTNHVSENREKETFIEKENKLSHTVSYESMETDDITTSHEIETLPSEDAHQSGKEEREPNQELSHDKTLTNDLKNKPSNDACENKEKKTFVEDEANTSSRILSNKNIVSNEIVATNDPKVIYTVPAEAPYQKTTKETSSEDIESEESANRITECVIAELKLLSPQNMLQELSQPEFDPDVEIAKKLDQGIEMVLGIKIENKTQKQPSSAEKRNSIDDKEQKTAALLDSAIEKVLGNSAATSKPTMQMTAAENDISKQTYQPKTTTEHIDFAIDAILGTKNASKPESVTSVVEKKVISPNKRKLGILTAEKINSSIEKLLENNRKNDLEHRTAESLNQSIEKILGQRISPIKLNECTTLDATIQSLPKKSSPKPEDVTAKKSMNKKYFTDMKIVSANVPEALFADDDSDNSNSGENSGPDNLKFFPPILSLDDLLHKKTDQILQIPCCANSDSCTCNREISDTSEEPTINGSRQYLGTPNFAIELEVETSTKSNTNEESGKKAAGENTVANVSGLSDAEAEELTTNLVEANTTNMENFVLSDISAIGIPIDFNMTNESFPDVMDIMLLDQVQQSIDCVISGNNYVQKWSQESYSTQTAKKNLVEKGRDKDRVSTSVPSEQHNICISQILDSNPSSANSSCANTIGIGQEINYSTINPLDEVEVSTNIGFDLVGNVTVEDLLADDGDDLFAFPELDKTRSRSNSYSNDSENFSNSTNDETIENMALTTKIIACDHSYNKEIEEKDDNESCSEQNAIESPKPIISSAPNFVTIGKTIHPEVKSSSSHNFTKLKSHPTPYWKIRKVDLKTSTPKRSSSFDEQAEYATATNTSDKVNSSTTHKAELSHVQKNLFYNMPELDLAPSKSENLPSKPVIQVIPIEDSINTDSQNEVQKIVQSVAESSALQEVVPKRLAIEITEMITIPAPSPISQETITTTIDESHVNSEIETEKSSSRSSTPTEISDTTAPAPTIITQPIITLQSQTNRLQRMDSISSQFQGNNEYPSFPSSTLTSSTSANCTPNREPTPTLDEPTKEEISLDDRTEQLSDELDEDTREKNADIVSLKRGSTPTMDEPPEKKICLEKLPKQHPAKDNIFDMLKRESPVNAVVCKPIVEKSVTSEGSKEELQTETSPVQTEEPKKEAKQECNPPVELKNNFKESYSTKGEESISLLVKPVELTKEVIPENKPCSKETKPKETFSEYPTCSKETNFGAEKNVNIIEYKCSLIDSVVTSRETESKAENNCTSSKILNSSATPVKISVQNSLKISTKPIPTISVAALPKIAKLKDIPTGISSTSKQDIGTLNKIKPLTRPTEPEILIKKVPTSTSSSKKSPYTASSAKNTTSPSSSKSSPASNNRPNPYNNATNNVKVNRNKYSYQRVESSTEVKYPTKCNNVPNAPQHKQTAKSTPDKKSHQYIPNSGYKPMPTMSHSNPHKYNTNSGPVTAANVKLSAADEAELKAKLDAYQKTLPQTKIYKEHREQLHLLKLQEEKLRLEYLEKEKRRQAQKLMSEAQRLKRKSYSESYEAHYKKFALSSVPNVSSSNSMPPHLRQPHQHSHQHKQPHSRQKYVNKFGEIEKNVASTRNNKEIVPSKAPLTITTAWEHKSASVDEIIEHLSKMKKS